MTNNKYELLEYDTKNVTYLIHPNTHEYSDPITLYRIRALKNFGDVKKGDLGGYIDASTVIGTCDDSWVYDNSIVLLSSIVNCHVKKSSVVITSTLCSSLDIETSVVYGSHIHSSYDNMVVNGHVMYYVAGELRYSQNDPSILCYWDFAGRKHSIDGTPYNIECLLQQVDHGGHHYVLAGGYDEQRQLNITWKPSFICKDMLKIQPLKMRHGIPAATFYGDCATLCTDNTLSSEEVQEILSRKCRNAFTREHDEPLALGESGNIISRDKITESCGDKFLMGMKKFMGTNYDDIDKNSLYVTHHKGVPVFEPEVEDDMMNEDEPDESLRLRKIKITDNAATPLRLTYRNEYNRDVICHVMKIQKTNDDGAPLYHKVFTSEGVCPCCGDQSDRCICDPDDDNDYEEYSLAELWLSLYEDNILFEY